MARRRPPIGSRQRSSSGTGARMQHWRESVGERGDRRRRGQDFDRAVRRAIGRLRPSVECEAEQSVVDQQPGLSIGVHHHGAGRQVVDARLPHQAVSGAVHAPTAAVALGDESPIQLATRAAAWNTPPPGSPRRGTTGRPPAGTTRRAGGRPPARRRRRGRRSASIDAGRRGAAANPELGHARDPQRTAVVAHDRAPVVDEAAAVPGEQAPTAHRVEVAPRVDAVTSGTHRRTFGRNCKASSSPSSALASNASAGTHSGNGVTILRCAPDAVCSSSMASSAGEGKRSARRTSAGQMRRWTSVTLPSMRRVATTAGTAQTVDGVENA